MTIVSNLAFCVQENIVSDLISSSQGIPPIDVWILATGFWNDHGIWMDGAFWID